MVWKQKILRTEVQFVLCDLARDELLVDKRGIVKMGSVRSDESTLNMSSKWTSCDHQKEQAQTNDDVLAAALPCLFDVATSFHALHWIPCSSLVYVAAVVWAETAQQMRKLLRTLI